MEDNKRYDYFCEAQTGKKTENKMDWMKRIRNSNVKTEQEKLVEKMKKVLNFLEHVQIENEESLVHINKPLDNLLSALKYLPIEPFFANLPVEIKTEILSYLCNSGAFVAALVCQEWGTILKERLTNMEQVRIGKCCLNKYSCDNNACFMPEEILKASINLKLDVPLTICYPVTNVVSKLLVEGLMSVSDFEITDVCECMEDHEDEPMLTREQIQDLFESLEKKDQMDSVYLRGLDMTHLDQDRLMNCLLLKVNNLYLDQGQKDSMEGSFGSQAYNYKPFLDFEIMIEKLLQVPINFKLSHLDLEFIEYPEESDIDVANALCRIKSLGLGHTFPLTLPTIKRLIENILHPFSMEWQGMVWQGQRSRIQSLSIHKALHWASIITAVDLKHLVTKMRVLDLSGTFTQEQVQAVGSLPGVRVDIPQNKTYIFISKNCDYLKK